MKNNEFQFGKSHQVAINFLSNFTEATKSWKNFIWFQKIAASEIQETGEDFSGGSKFKMLKREILFYGYLDILMARVCLVGNQFTNSDDSKPTFWKVTEVGYAQQYNEARIFAESEWIEVEIKEKDQVLH